MSRAGASHQPYSCQGYETRRPSQVKHLCQGLQLKVSTLSRVQRSSSLRENLAKAGRFPYNSVCETSSWTPTDTSNLPSSCSAHFPGSPFLPSPNYNIKSPGQTSGRRGAKGGWRLGSFLATKLSATAKAHLEGQRRIVKLCRRIVKLPERIVQLGLWNLTVGLWNFPSGLCNLDCETWKADCETIKRDCETLKSDCETVKRGLWNSEVGFWNCKTADCETLQADCETLRTDCETSIVKLWTHIVNVKL